MVLEWGGGRKQCATDFRRVLHYTKSSGLWSWSGGDGKQYVAVDFRRVLHHTKYTKPGGGLYRGGDGKQGGADLNKKFLAIYFLPPFYIFINLTVQTEYSGYSEN